MTDNETKPEERTECPTCGRADFASLLGLKQHHARAHGESIAGVLMDCEWCGETTRRQPSNTGQNEHTFCDHECYGEWRGKNRNGDDNNNYNSETIECSWCGTSLTRPASRVDNVTHSFCDHDCCAEWRAEHWQNEDHPCYNQQELTCEWCGEDYTEKASRAEQSRFCSASCRGHWVAETSTFAEENPPSGPENPCWKENVRCECEWCGEEYEVMPSQADRTRFCSQKCSAKGPRSGAVSHIDPKDWSPADTTEYGENWQKQREEAREHAGYKCQKCGVHESDYMDGEYELDVHHITPFRKFNDYKAANRVSNLVVLCRGCHIQVEKFAPLLPSDVDL